MVGNGNTPERAEGAPEALESDRTAQHLRHARQNLEEVKAHYFRVEPDEASPSAETPMEIASERPPRGDVSTTKFEK